MFSPTSVVVGKIGILSWTILTSWASFWGWVRSEIHFFTKLKCMVRTVLLTCLEFNLLLFALWDCQWLSVLFLRYSRIWRTMSTCIMLLIYTLLLFYINIQLFSPAKIHACSSLQSLMLYSWLGVSIFMLEFLGHVL